MPSTSGRDESERETRERRVDKQLLDTGWEIVRKGAVRPARFYRQHALEEYETANGPADYALCVDGKVLGIVEAKKLSISPQNVLMQAERYARGISESPFNFRGLRAPFLYSTNGEVIAVQVIHADSRLTDLDRDPLPRRARTFCGLLEAGRTGRIGFRGPRVAPST